MERSHPVHELIVRESVNDSLKYLGEDFKNLVSKEDLTENDKQTIADAIYPFVTENCFHFGIIDPDNFQIEETALDVALHNMKDQSLNEDMVHIIEAALAMGARKIAKVAPGRFAKSAALNKSAVSSKQRMGQHLKTSGSRFQQAGSFLKNRHYGAAAKTAAKAAYSGIRGVARGGLAAGQKMASDYMKSSAKSFARKPAQQSIRDSSINKIKMQGAEREKGIWGKQ